MISTSVPLQDTTPLLAPTLMLFIEEWPLHCFVQHLKARIHITGLEMVRDLDWRVESLELGD